MAKKKKNAKFNIILFPYYIVKITIKGFLQQVSFLVKGFKTLSLFLSRGFYYYFEKLFTFLKKITKIEFLQKPINYFKIRREEPSHIVLIIVWFLTLLFLYDSLYTDNESLIAELPTEDIQIKVAKEQVEEQPSPKENELLTTDFNLYRIFNKYSIKDINIKDLQKRNSDTVSWIIVEGTTINYPIVQTDNNDYYLSHSFDKSYTYNGWTFLDYRNDSDMNDQNTIFYGHNLLNGTAFGSIKKIFENPNNNKIMIITSSGKKYTYQIFSGYTIEPEIYYLQTNFSNTESYRTFLETLSNRNTINIDNSVDVNDKIITLSTCTDDNNGRRVLHAKLIS